MKREKPGNEVGLKAVLQTGDVTSLRYQDSKGEKNVTKQQALKSKTNTVHVRYTF